MGSLAALESAATRGCYYVRRCYKGMSPLHRLADEIMEEGTSRSNHSSLFDCQSAPDEIDAPVFEDGRL